MAATTFEDRKGELLNECELAPRVFQRVMTRLERFMIPFVDCLVRREQVEHAGTFLRGLLSDLNRKNAESIAYRFDQERMPLQWFLGVSPWHDEPLRGELARQVGKQLGQADGVIVFDPSAFPKSGKESAGVARQWCGRLGKIENCQVGIPKNIRHRTRHHLSLDMLAKHGGTLPHSWITGDDEMGRPYWFRRRLSKLSERYLLAVPSNTQVRDLQVDPPQYSGHGRPPKRPWTRVDRWLATLGCRMHTWKPNCWNSVGQPRRNIGSRSAFSARRAKPVWPTMKFALGAAGIIIKPYR